MTCDEIMALEGDALTLAVARIMKLTVFVSDGPLLNRFRPLDDWNDTSRVMLWMVKNFPGFHWCIELSDDGASVSAGMTNDYPEDGPLEQYLGGIEGEKPLTTICRVALLACEALK